jgi:protein-tyrosine phosphatase
MLTAESEGGQLKCHPYWSGKEFGPIKLRALSEKKVSLDIDKSRSNSIVTPAPSSESSSVSQAELGRRRANTTTSADPNAAPAQAQGILGNQASAAGETPYVILRKFALSHAAHPFSPIREVTQLHYPSWPDFGAPAQPSHLLALVELANVMQRAALPVDVPSKLASITDATDEPGTGRQTVKKVLDTTPLSWHDSPATGENERPMLVHCSAGCGRTGAFCTVDSVIDMLKRQRQAQAQGATNRQPAAPQTPEKRKRNSVVSGRSRVRDAEGDIDMDATLSPMDASKDKDSSTFFQPMSTPGARATSGNPGAKGPSDGTDIDLSWLDDDTVDLVASTVEDFRRQRLSMVQSLRQFVLCYETAIEYIWRQQQRGPSPGGATGRNRARSGSLNR